MTITASTYVMVGYSIVNGFFTLLSGAGGSGSISWNWSGQVLAWMQWAKEVYNEYKDAAFDVIQTALTIASFISPPGLSAVFGLINLGIDYARGKPVDWKDVGLAVLPGVGALGRVAGVGVYAAGLIASTASLMSDRTAFVAAMSAAMSESLA